MESRVTLRLLDEQMQTEYLTKRNREILTISIGIYILVISANIAVAVVTFASEWYDYMLEMMLPRSASIILHGLLIFMSWKHPLKTV